MQILKSGVLGPLGPNQKRCIAHLQTLLNVPDELPPLLMAKTRLAFVKGALEDSGSAVNGISVDLVWAVCSKLPRLATYWQVWHWQDEQQPTVTLTAIQMMPKLNNQTAHICGLAGAAALAAAAPQCQRLRVLSVGGCGLDEEAEEELRALALTVHV